MISVRSVVNPFFAAHEGRRTRQEILPRFRHLLPYGRITMLSGTHKGGPYAAALSLCNFLIKLATLAAKCRTVSIPSLSCQTSPGSRPNTMFQ